MERVRRFIPGAKISGVLLVLTSAAVGGIYGVDPLVNVSNRTRDLILLIWFWNWCIFALCGGMVIFGWAVDRYADPPKNDGD